MSWDLFEFVGARQRDWDPFDPLTVIAATLSYIYGTTVVWRSCRRALLVSCLLPAVELALAGGPPLIPKTATHGGKKGEMSRCALKAGSFLHRDFRYDQLTG
jgi:hypothetical protein